MDDDDFQDELVLVEVEQRFGAGPQEVIDLTEEPDSPPRRQPDSPPQPRPRRLYSPPRRRPHQPHLRHARRPGPPRRTPPAFNRSDGSLLGGGGGGGGAPEVIDLTGEEVERPRAQLPQPQPPPPPPPPAAFPPLPRPRDRDVDVIWLGRGQGQVIRRNPRHDLDAARAQMHLIEQMFQQGDAAHGPFALNYARSAFDEQQAPPPPPQRVELPTREGFTRDTGEETVLICPACRTELEYDPMGEAQQETGPNGKRKSRKDKGEHHFWAVKACGHVFCQKCFENRKPTAKTRNTGFRPVSGNGNGNGTKLLCAVDDCDSEVGSKTAWVGLFI